MLLLCTPYGEVLNGLATSIRLERWIDLCVGQVHSERRVNLQVETNSIVWGLLDCCECGASKQSVSFQLLKTMTCPSIR